MDPSQVFRMLLGLSVICKGFSKLMDQKSHMEYILNTHIPEDQENGGWRLSDSAVKRLPQVISITR